MYVSLVGVCLSCDVQRNETGHLKMQVDSLKAELQMNQQAVEALHEIGSLIDSIDADRLVLKTLMVEGTSLEDYTLRMRNITSYVHEVQRKIGLLEDRVRLLKGSNANYASAIKKLKLDVAKRNQELVVLQSTVTRYRNENDNLIQTVSLQEAEISDKLRQIQVKEEEVVTLEKDVTDLMIKSKFEEAESYYARALAVEEAAKRTHFAPRKKKDTKREALELYKMAAFYGKEEAQDKIALLEKDI